MQFLLHHGRSPISALIRWQTRSEYSHASVRINDRQIIEAVEGQGVIVSPLPSLELADRFEVNTSMEQALAVKQFLFAQAGKSYDWTMVIRFITRRQESRKSTGRWFCSELVFAAFLHAGVALLARTEPWEVSPGLLAKSPLALGPLTA